MEAQTRVLGVLSVPVPDPITPCRHTHTHTCTKRDKEKSEIKRAQERERERERSLQSDHSGYFPRVLSVTMEIWKIAPAV